jgi:TrkA domain protein
VPEVHETLVPGVGLRHEFTTGHGERIAVLTHRGGRRQVAIYRRDDPDATLAAVHLTQQEASALAELLGATQLSEAVTSVQQQIEGLAIDWLTVEPGSGSAGATIAEAQFRTRTGSSIVAVLRGDTTIPAPGPELRLAGGDVVVAVGRPDGLSQLRALLG